MIDLISTLKLFNAFRREKIVDNWTQEHNFLTSVQNEHKFNPIKVKVNDLIRKWDEYLTK